MMRQAEIYSNGILAGILTETDAGKYIFEYDRYFLSDNSRKAISLTLPKRKEPYISDTLFPFFSNMLSEGANKSLQCRALKLDEKDDLGLLLATGSTDTIGAITVKEI